MDLSIYSKSLEDYKNSILEVLDKAYSINTEHFYKPNTNNKAELSRMWGDEYSLNEPIKQFKQEGTKEYLEDKLSEIYKDCKVIALNEPYQFKTKIKVNTSSSQEQIAKLSSYINKYKNVRSVCVKNEFFYQSDLKVYSGTAIRTIQKIRLQPKLETKLKADFKAPYIAHLRIQERITL